LKTLLTIGTSHVESGHDFLDIRNHMQADPVDARVYQPADLFFKTWPGYLQTQLKDTRVVNLGVSGHGLDYVIPRTYAAIDFFKPDTIILEFPSITRFTMANHDKPYKPQQHLIYSLSHIQTEDKYHHCEEIQKRRCLTAGVVGKQHRGFHKQWLDQIDEFSYINHLYKFKMLCSYIQSHDIELHTFSFNGDGFDIGEMHTDFHIDTHVTQEKLQSVFESNGVWEWSLDGSGHAGWNTERWMVANLFLPVLR
jgi:hypothetical protein